MAPPDHHENDDDDDDDDDDNMSTREEESVQSLLTKPAHQPTYLPTYLGFRKQFTSKLDEEFAAKVQSFCQQVYGWMTMLEAKMTPSARYERDHIQAISVR